MLIRHYIKKMKKSKTRLYISEPITANLLLYIRNKQHHFLKNVIRAKINDEINIFDGITGEWNAIIIEIGRDNIVLRVNKNINNIISSPDIWLVFAPIKQQRMNLAIQKATELGVSKIIPCITEYTNIRNINIQNLHDNAIEASEQSERLDIPKIEKETNLNHLLLNWPANRKLIYCDEKNKQGKSLIEQLLCFKNIKEKWGVIIGPEGGFSNKEKESLIKFKNIVPVSLGNRLLRSDTAITVSLYCIQELLA